MADYKTPSLATDIFIYDDDFNEEIHLAGQKVRRDHRAGHLHHDAQGHVLAEGRAFGEQLPLHLAVELLHLHQFLQPGNHGKHDGHVPGHPGPQNGPLKIGRASCRERV